MSTKFKGFIYGVGTAVTFGLIPLFTLPLMREGMQSDSILFYRFLVSTVALGLMMIAKRESFAIAWGDLPVMLLLSLFYTASALFLLYGYEVMGAGVATTVLLSALGYASYIVTVNKSRVRNMHSRKLAFYVFAFTSLAFLAKTGFGEGIQPVHGAWPVFNIIMLAVAPTVISNITLLLAVRNIGGTLTSILGALEPVTAVCIGVLVFGEAFTFNEAVGMVLILAAVSLVILGKGIRDNLNILLKRIRPRHP